MKAAKWSVVAVAVALLVACRGHEQTVAGTYGMSSVNGQVVMATGGSPAGVSVTVRGTGQTMLLGEDGGFSFNGVPEDVQLVFTRSDGIHATFDAGRNSSVVVELSSNSASSRGRSRSAPSTPHWQNTQAPHETSEFEGTVKAITAGSLTLDSRGGDVVLQIDSATTFTPAAPVVGDRVHVRAQKSGDALVAVSVRLQGSEDEGEPGEHHGGATMTANGKVTAPGASQLTVESESHGSVTVKIDSHTIIKKQGVHIAAGDIRSGDSVNARGTRIDDHSLLAEQIEVRGEGGHK